MAARRGLRKSLTVLAALVLTASAEAAVSSPARADIGDCEYPYVCLYNSSGTRVARYGIPRAYFKQLVRTDVTRAVNTRHHDSVYFNYATGVTSCILHDRSANLRIEGYGRVTGIRIAREGTCF